MKKLSKLLSIFVALILIIGGIPFSSIAFGEEDTGNEVINIIDDITEEQEEVAENKAPVDETLHETEDEPAVPIDEQEKDEEVIENEQIIEEVIAEETQIMSLVQPLSNPNQYSIKTTDESGEEVNGNVKYESKFDVYVRIDGDIQNYWVIVESPNGTFLGSGGPFEPGHHFNLYDATHFDDTDNNGGEYKVGVCIDNTFHSSKTKYDNFKVKEKPQNPNGQIIVTKIVKNNENVLIDDDTTIFTFELYKEVNGSWIYQETKTIQGNGTVTFNTLEDGKYLIKEINIPDKYSLISNNDIEVTISKNEETTVTFTNKKDAPPTPSWTGTLVIQKIIESNNAALLAEESPDLSGFEFELWNEEGKVVGPLSTGDDGTVTFDNLPAGEYEIRETNSKGYIPKGPFYFNLNPDSTNDGIYYHDFYNEPIPVEDIVIQKIVVDKENKNPDLKGFTFKLYRLVEVEGESTEEFVKEITTEEDGLAIFEDLEFGNYILYESPVEGYEMGLGDYGSEKGLQIVHSEEYTGAIEVTNTKVPKWEGTIEVIKSVVDTRNTTPGLSGFTFRLYKSNETLEEFIEEQTTESMGIISFTGLGEGVYKLYELDRAGYIKGISNSGLSLVLNRETANEDRILKVNITNTVDYPEDPEDPEEPEEPENPEEPEDP